MAIPAIPQKLYVTQANRQVFIQWGLVAGATSYSIQRSTDGVTYTVYQTPSTNSYLDTAVTVGTQYWYKVASVNSSGTSPYTNPQSVVPTPSGEMSLGELRTRSQEKADRLNSNFVSLPEWNFFIDQAMYELYDLLITVYEDYFYAEPATFTTDGTTANYPLPNGLLTFQDSSGSNFAAKPLYKLRGVDLALGATNANSNGWVTVDKFNFIDRNRFVYPNTASTIYGVFNLNYRMMGSNINFIPTPSANQRIRLLYIPRLAALLQDTDITDIGISGWLQYVIVRAAKYALDKEESDTTKLDEELIFLKKRIEESAPNRDAGSPDTISDTRSFSGGGWMGGGPTNGNYGGY